MLSGFVIKRDGDPIGFVTDEQLADEIDGMEISNEAYDPAYRHRYEYTVERGGGS